MRRVVVTGLGVITPLGTGVERSWSGLIEGRSGIRAITRFDTSAYPVRIAGEVPDFDPACYFDVKEARRLDLFLQYSLAVARMAMESSGLEIDDALAERAGVYVSSGIGGMQSLEDARDTVRDRGPRKVSPFVLPRLLINMAPGTISIAHNLRGPCLSHVSACASGSHSLGEAFLAIRYDRADVMLAGGSEAAVTPLSIAAFSQMRALSTRNDTPVAASRPFDAERDGFVMGEGAGMVVLEELEHARRRGARIYCELAGYAQTADAHHVTAPAPEGEGAARCMRQALADARIGLDQVQYINAHGTATEMNDALETAAVKGVFGDHARNLCLSSNKSMTGHLLGAAGAMEAVFTALSIAEGVVPPTINYQTPDPACDLDYVPNSARRMPIDVAMSNSFGFGGMNATLVFRRFVG